MDKKETLQDQIAVREQEAGYAPEKMKLELDAIKSETELERVEKNV
jgi:hypothetical protein